WGVLSVRSLGGVLAGAFLCVALLRFQPGLIGMEPQSDVLPQSYVGLLTDSAGKPTVLASSKRHGKVMTVKLLQPVAIPAGTVAQLWALPKDGSAAFRSAWSPAVARARWRLRIPRKRCSSTCSGSRCATHGSTLKLASRLRQ